MGAWDATAFSNDEAADCAYGLEAAEDPVQFLQQTLAAAAGGEYLDACTGTLAVAASAVVASARDAETQFLRPNWLRG